MVNDEELESLEEQVRELKQRQELREKEAELRKKKRVLELQDSWWGQILLGLKIYLEKTPKALGKVLDWLIPPPEPQPNREKPPEPDIQDPEKQEDQGEDRGLSMEQELYRAMGGTVDVEQD